MRLYEENKLILLREQKNIKYGELSIPVVTGFICF